MKKIARKAIREKKEKDEDSYSYLDKAIGVISLVGDVTHKMASVFRQQVKVLERTKKHSTIVVEINSGGGDVEAGLLIVDTIQQSSKPVTTRVAGIAKSMGGVILMAGARREALPNSFIMFHQASYDLSASHQGIDAEVAFNKNLESVCNELMDRQTGHEPGYWESRYQGKNLYFNAAQALEEKLVHSIVVKKAT